MKSLLFLFLFGLCNGLLAQQPIIKKATKADTSENINTYKIDTPENRWEGGEVKNYFRYDSLQNDSIKPKQIRAIKRKNRKIKKQRIK